MSTVPARGVLRLRCLPGYVYALDCPYPTPDGDDCPARITVEIDPGCGPSCGGCEEHSDFFIAAADGCAHVEGELPDGGVAILQTISDHERARAER